MIENAKSQDIRRKDDPLRFAGRRPPRQTGPVAAISKETGWRAPAVTTGPPPAAITYTRRKTAPGEATFLVDWSGTLANDWTNSGIGLETPVPSTPQSETVKVALPAATNGRCFVRLQVTSP